MKARYAFIGLLGFFLGAAWAVGQGSLKFISVRPDDEYEKADERLHDYLDERLHDYLQAQVSLAWGKKPSSYGEAIQTVTEWNRAADGSYLARLTPYAYVAAEMLGADFEILATYKSRATGSLTYHSYFVVNRAKYRDTLKLPAEARPTLDGLPAYLQSLSANRLPRFVFHDKFSTSSYFLPSLYFRAHRIFAMEKSRGSLTAISIGKVRSSDDLVKEVAEGTADLAAVWDGTKSKYQRPELQASFGSKVEFIQLPDVLPNDLLVVSSWEKTGVKEQIRKAIGENKEKGGIHEGDFEWWEDIAKAPEARRALGSLRREAAAPPAAVTIGIDEPKDPVLRRYVQAARQAVRLSGTEFVLNDPDLRKQQADVEWTLKLIHDGAVTLTSDIKDSQLPPQEFPISFQNEEDLTTRIGTLIHSRLHRIRYVWPYQDAPTIIRDVDFAPFRSSILKAQQISWDDPGNDEFTSVGPVFNTGLSDDPDFYKFRLNKEGFRKADGTLEFEPMSNTAYRVILVRPSRERWWLKASTIAFPALLALAAIAAVLDVRRRRPAPPDTDGKAEGTGSL